jgi:glycosyltransferase involved in cell wall biosynthesis
LPAFHKRLSAVLASLSGDAEILYVDDGSSDGTWSIVQQLCQEDPRVAILRMSRNFGKEIAMTAGLDHANGDAVVLIDADLQDPPELIPELLKHWRDGYDVVYAKRTAREGESMIKMATAYTFGQNV